MANPEILHVSAKLEMGEEASPNLPYVAAQIKRPRGVTVRYRASLEQDLEALDAHQPDLAIGTTPVVQKAKERAIPALYFTNLISARPLFGLAGAGSLATVVNAALGNKPRFDRMKAFFEGVGSGDTAGVWSKTPDPRPDFRAKYRRQLDALAKKRKAEEML